MEVQEGESDQETGKPGAAEAAVRTPAIPAVAEANRLMGITPGLGESLGVQLDRLLAQLSS